MSSDFMQQIDQLDPFTKILILVVLIIFIGMFIMKLIEFPDALEDTIRLYGVPLLIALLIYGLSTIWPSIQQFFLKISEFFSGIPELFSKIPRLFSDIISWFTNKLTV